jgi:hypothetical protein
MAYDVDWEAYEAYPPDLGDLPTPDAFADETVGRALRRACQEAADLGLGTFDGEVWTPAPGRADEARAYSARRWLELSDDPDAAWGVEPGAPGPAPRLGDDA